MTETAGRGKSFRRVLGLTGGAGAGKSLVLAYLRDHCHAHVIECDEVGRELQKKGGACYAPTLDLFGPGILRADGELDRSKIAKIIFADPQMKKKLERIIHPAVKYVVTREAERVRRAEAFSLLAVESAILIEENYEALCDEVWYIHAPKEVRARRLIKSRGYSRQRVQAVMAAQRDEEFYLSHCDLVIENGTDSPEDTFRQIDRGLKEHGFLYDCQREQR